MIRTAKQNEINIIVEFQQRMAFETENLQLDNNTLYKGVSSIFKNPEKGKYYIAEIENEIVGCTLITFEWSDWRNSTIIWLQSVYILPEHRKKGIFKQIYTHIKNIVQNSEDYCGIKLYVDKTNINAQKVYKNIGMTDEHYSTFEWMK